MNSYHTANSLSLTPEEWKERKKEKRKGYLFRFGAVICWGIQPIFLKYTPVHEVSPFAMVFLMGIGGVILSFALITFFSLFLSRKFPRVRDIAYKNKSLWIIIIGAVFYYFFINASLQNISGINFILIASLAPLISLIIAELLWRDKISYLRANKSTFYIFTVFFISSIGIVVLFLNKGMMSTGAFIWGNIFASLAIIADVIFVIGQVKYAPFLRKYQSILLNFIIFLVVTFIGFPLFLLSLHGSDPLFFSHYLFSIGAGILNGLGQILNYEAFRRIDGFLAFLMFHFSILITFIIEAYLLDTIVLTPFLFLGASMIIGASIVAEKVNSQCEKQGL
jgi:drug/metabolite transporter (DMT)-like permease